MLPPGLSSPWPYPGGALACPARSKQGPSSTPYTVPLALVPMGSGAFLTALVVCSGSASMVVLVVPPHGSLPVW